MRNTLLHESHLLEAVRRKILSNDQMEQVLALARSSPAGGAVADVRWATVVQGLIAAAAVMGSGIGILADVSDHGADFSHAVASSATITNCVRRARTRPTATSAASCNAASASASVAPLPLGRRSCPLPS